MMSSHDHGNCELCDALERETKWLRQEVLNQPKAYEALIVQHAALEGVIKDAARFLDVEVRSWLPSEHAACDSACSHYAFEQDMFDRLDAMIAALSRPQLVDPLRGSR